MENIYSFLKVKDVEATCPIHGCHLQTIVGKNIKPVCPKCQLEKLLAEKKQFDEKIAADRFRKALRANSLVDDKDTFNCSFDNFKHNSGTLEDRNWQLCHKLAGAYFKDNNAQFNSLLVGRAGTGKSHLAMSILKAVNDNAKPAVKCLFINVPMLFQKIRSSFNDPSEFWTEAKAIDAICNANLVVLDDLGTEAAMRQNHYDEASQFTQRVLYSITNGQKRLIVTSNLSLKELQVSYNPKLVSRLLRGAKGHVVDFTQLSDKRADALKF